MTVAVQTPVKTHTGTGAVTVFAYDFLILAAADMRVTVDGVVKTITTHYSVSGVGSGSGGDVTFVTAPANGAVVVLKRAMEIKRTAIDYQESGDLLSSTHNDDHDAPVMMAQQLSADLLRAFKAPENQIVDLSISQADWTARAGKFLRVKTDGSGIELVAADIDAALGQFVQSGTGAVTRSWQSKVGQTQMTPQDFGGVADGATNTAADIGQAATERATTGGIVDFPPSATEYLIGSTLTLPKNVTFRGQGHSNTALKLANNSDVAMIASAGFATLTGTGAYLDSAGVPNGFAIEGLRLDGNKANQASGNGINLFGKRFRLHDILVTDAKGVGIFSELGLGGTVTPWQEMVEAYWNYVIVRGSGSHNIQFRGPHDARLDNIFSALAGGDGVRLESSGATYNAVSDLGFVHTYGNTGIGLVTIGAQIKASHIEAESNYKEGISIDANSSDCQFGLIQLFNNDFAGTSTYFNGVLAAQEVTVDNLHIIDGKSGAGGFQITGANSRVALAHVKNTGNTNAGAVGVDLNAAGVAFKGKIVNYNTAGQIGLRTTNGTNRANLNIDAFIENCAIGWSHVTGGNGGSYKIRISTGNKDHLLFSGVGPALFDPGAGGSFTARELWDVIAQNTGTSHTGTAQAGAAGSITLAASGPSAVNDVYNGAIITITGGTGNGQVRVISDYVGSTKVASVTPNWTTPPDNTSTYSVGTLVLRSHSEGTAVVPNGSTTVTIPHGLLETSMTPTGRNIKIWPINSLGTATRGYVSAVGKFTFTITVDADPGATTAIFGWKADLSPS